KEEVRIVADEVTNSLIILATRRDYQLILDVVRRIDVVPRQVLLETAIAEIELNKNLQFGVEWAIAQNLGINNLSPTDNEVFRSKPTGLPSGGLISPGIQRVPPAGAVAMISARPHSNLFTTALAPHTNLNMPSTPRL